MTCKTLKTDFWNANHSDKITVTCSIGAAYCEKAEGLNYKLLIEEAEDAVYQAKTSGRDKYIIKKL